eukprot:TRINITY_DN18572_c0_g1_i1.p1 TRINITY_DN18572_c0_g1~~TRINITY_DN18572_c0_g1_i1.p1  ORF type:complete len:114 (-),score=27.15 TRINITY_DN18572_c0_g1_i1:512-832(-)
MTFETRYRQWRESVMDAYRGTKSKAAEKVPPIKELLLQDFVELDSEHARHEAKVQQLVTDLKRLREEVVVAKEGGFLSVSREKALVLSCLLSLGAFTALLLYKRFK